MKKVALFTLVLGLSSPVLAHDLFYGDGTYHVKSEKKSTATRAEVLSSTNSMDLANALDGSIKPKVELSRNVSRADVIRKMEGFEYANYGDGTSTTPWVRTESDTRNLARSDNNADGTNMN